MKENIIHIKLEYQEALEAKKDILSSEMNLLRIAKKIKKYREFREEELELKLELFKKIKETKANIGKLQKTLPTLKIPEILKKYQEDTEIIGIKKTTKEKPYDDLEYELQKIKDKLDALKK